LFLAAADPWYFSQKLQTEQFILLHIAWLVYCIGIKPIIKQLHQHQKELYKNVTKVAFTVSIFINFLQVHSK